MEFWKQKSEFYCTKIEALTLEGRSSAKKQQEVVDNLSSALLQISRQTEWQHSVTKVCGP